MILRNCLLLIAFVTGAETLADDSFEKRIRPFFKPIAFPATERKRKKERSGSIT